LHYVCSGLNRPTPRQKDLIYKGLLWHQTRLGARLAEAPNPVPCCKYLLLLETLASPLRWFHKNQQWGSDMARGVLSGEGAQAGLGVLTGLLVVAMILFATTFLAGG
jgi:hypothetical protein